jgi:hypothetical protein
MWTRVCSSQGNLESSRFSSCYNKPYYATNHCLKHVSIASLDVENSEVSGLKAYASVDRRSVGLGILLSHLFANDIYLPTITIRAFTRKGRRRIIAWNHLTYGTISSLLLHFKMQKGSDAADSLVLVAPVPTASLAPANATSNSTSPYLL